LEESLVEHSGGGEGSVEEGGHSHGNGEHVGKGDDGWKRVQGAS
jgi:hypothetical protein